MRSDVRHVKAHLFIALIDVCLEDETPLAHIMGARVTRLSESAMTLWSAPV